jgi:anti-anti-sigma factor
MEFTVTEKAESINIVVDGNIAVLNFKNFQQELASISANSDKDMVLDLINMDYITSTSIGDLMNLKKAQAKKGKKLLFNNVSTSILRPLIYCQLLDSKYLESKHSKTAP